MPVWAIIPIKPLRRGKSRLSKILSDEEREYLNENLLLHTINCLENTPEIEHIAVISHDPTALRITRTLNVKTIQENRNTNLNNALRKATKIVQSFNADQLLIIPADLPRILPRDISGLINKSKGEREIIISPDRKVCGTNALLINPIGILDYDFGPWSFKKHIEQAERKKIRVEIYNNKNIAFDLDLPEDYEEYKKNLDVNFKKNLENLIISGGSDG